MGPIPGGGGVVIGHPDTGYRLHAEIAKQVLEQKAVNYVEKGQVALDTLKGYASSHGTKTASVMGESSKETTLHCDSKATFHLWRRPPGLSLQRRGCPRVKNHPLPSR